MIPTINFNLYFRFTSYAVVACGALALLASDGINLLTAGVFAVLMVILWQLESTKWQISERLGLVLIMASLPLFYVDWQSQTIVLSRERAGAATLAHLIMALSLVKLWQKKTDRDWVFLYLISFFEVLLAAGLSISPLFLATLVLYLFFAACTIIAFEIRKSEKNVQIIDSVDDSQKNQLRNRNSVARLPVVATTVLFLIIIVAVPMFFLMPRVGGAGFGGGSNGLSGMSVGFSDSVTLGAIGKLQQSNEVVMRIRLEKNNSNALNDLRWRGVALDFFDNKGWRKSTSGFGKRYDPGEIKNRISLGKWNGATDILAQTVYLEPLDTQTLFAAPRAVAIEGDFQNILVDAENGLSYPRNSPERTMYKVFSDVSQPNPSFLRTDNSAYSSAFVRYLQLPTRYDARIEKLARDVAENAGAKNRYDKARAIESYLQNDFAYSLDLKDMGDEPLAGFLFDVREGHCEYFASSMAVMLRTQGIATRIVNGFQHGDYNDAADAYIVTQKDAHSWVEVYFPESDSWVVFDPTPAAGKDLSSADGNFVSARIAKYLEAMQMFWLQYVVAYDNQEQRSLARNVFTRVSDYRQDLTEFATKLKDNLVEWWNQVRGQDGATASFYAILRGALLLLSIVCGGILVWFTVKMLRRTNFLRKVNFFGRKSNSTRIIEFYERMTKLLSKKGLSRQTYQTPLEFAENLAMPEAVKITTAYNRVRFGDETLSQNEIDEIETWLTELEIVEPAKTS
ncbi:MAG: DUF3488 domain-containing protein [Pyrinomonadaceae bacterium]|nr:DUF3488 domain-containing protein [Pyrinomonadaceae bacterium]